MLTNGPYPADLKRRIKSDTGHLSNDQTARYLADNYRDHLQMIFLCHLSKENNRPDLAFNTVEQKLTQMGVKVGEDVKLITLERFTPTPLYLLS
jgi:phosphoribosyl 1,2-cyclic phosphodiesterase